MFDLHSFYHKLWPFVQFWRDQREAYWKIKWKGDTPHVEYPHIKNINEAAAPPLLTSELMWISDSHTGDYHDNTNGKMCLKLITTKVILLAARTYPGVQMVLVIYNAPYHHVRGIPSFTSFSNKSTSNLRKEHGINYVTLRWPMSKSVSYPSSKIIPSTTVTFKLLLTNKSFREEKTKSNALKNPSDKELRVSTIVWMKRHNPKVLCCKVEKSVKGAGGKILWTPPYCLELHPIELYWSAGKENVSST